MNVIKKILIGIVISGLGITGYCVSAFTQRPLLSAEPADIDFGSIRQNEIVNRDIKLTNNSGAYLPITRILTSCGCTTTSDLKGIGPHASSVLHVKFDSVSKIGPIDKTIIVMYPYKNQSTQLLLKLHGTIAQFVSTQPHDSLDFGVLRTGESRTRHIDVSRVDGSPFGLARLKTASDMQAVLENRSRSTAQLNVTVKAPSAAGRYNHAVTILFSDGAPACAVPVQYSVASSYAMSPESLNFGVIARGSPISRHLQIRGPHVHRLTLASAPPQLHVRLHDLASDTVQLTAEYVGPFSSGSWLNSQVVLKTNDPREPKLYLPVYVAIDQPAGNH